MRLDIKALSIACGLVWGLGIFAVTWWIIAWDGASGDPSWIGQIYRGYSVSPAGSFIGLAWGLIDGAIGGAVVAWLYNRFSATG